MNDIDVSKVQRSTHAKGCFFVNMGFYKVNGRILKVNMLRIASKRGNFLISAILIPKNRIQDNKRKFQHGLITTSMKKQFILTALLLTSIQWTNSQSLSYPATRKTDQTDEYFGTKVADPYRWLEDDKSTETAEWVKAQNKVTFDYLEKIPFRPKLKERLTQLWNYPKQAAPFKGGNNYFMYMNDGLQNQYILNILKGKWSAKPEPFLDPNSMSADGTVNIGSVSVSKDGKWVAYEISNGGSDWSEILIRNTWINKDAPEKLEWIKFSGIAWEGNGFYYSRYDAPDSANVLKGKNEHHKVYYHSMNSPQKADRLVFEDKANPLRNFGAGTTEDERYLILAASEGTSGNSLMIKNLKKPKAEWKTIVADFTNDYNVVDNDSSTIYILTNKGASNYKLVAVNAENPTLPWKDILPETTEVLEEVAVGNNMFIAKYMKDAHSLLKIYDKKGKFLYDIPMETVGTVDQLSASRKDETFFYSLNTFTAPSTIYRFNLKTKENAIFFRPRLGYNPSDYETKQIFYTSKDGTKVPMFIVHKKGVVLNGANPTLLFGYGGFSLPQTPIFKLERLVFMENGGVFALANIRGGSEYGENWHEAGTKLKKQNVFDDFIAAAEYLIKEKYTNPEKLGINGRSNGGLLVGAVMTQRPELFKVAIPTVGVMDMLRYHTFTIGWAWKGDYGSSEDETNFKNLLSYSPLHNIRENVNYPATLVTTGDHDDRVVPAHSFKFISTLQEKYKGSNPVLIRIDVNAGHAGTTVLGSSKPISKQIEEQTDIFSFLMYNLGMTVN